MFNDYPDILTVDEACEILRIGYNAIYANLNSGKLRAYRNGRVWRIPKQSVINFVTENTSIWQSIEAIPQRDCFCYFKILCSRDINQNPCSSRNMQCIRNDCKQTWWYSSVPCVQPWYRRIWNRQDNLQC